jgi:autotransporter-associated beta strand protein
VRDNPDTNADHVVISGDISNGDATPRNLQKNGAGKLLLNGVNTYTGLTTVSAGTLGGSGTIAGNVTVAAAANLAPGASAGTLSIGGNLDISAPANSTGKLDFELGTLASSDKIAVTDTLTIGSGKLGLGDFNLTDLGGLQNGTYTLISSGTLSGSLDAANVNGTLGLATIQLQISGNDVVLAVSGLVAGTPYETWATGSEPFDGDANNDGVPDGLAFLLGAATPATAATGKLPKVSRSGGNLVMEFDCLATAARGGSVLNLQYDGNLLAPWTSVPVPGAVGNTTVGNVSFVATANGSLIHIVATIDDAAEAAAGKLFGRLQGTE